MLDQVDAFFSLLDRYRNFRSKKPRVDSIANRFVLLFEKHGIHRNQIPRFFGHGLTLADVSDDDKLLNKLDTEILNAASELFAVRLEWLEGVDGIIYKTHDFYKKPEAYRAFLANIAADRERLIFAELVWSNDARCQEDALLILKEPITEHGNQSVERYHLCSNWSSKYWKSRADLAACIAMTEKQPHVFLKGNKTAGDITDFSQGKRFVTDLDELPYAYQRDWLFRKRYQPWEPDQWLYDPDAYLEGIDEGDFGKAAALSNWLAHYERGYMQTGHPRKSARMEFMAALEKYKNKG
ncbi:hypothetical protein [Methylomonas koyamae]|uniref:hypothetical protein n=1 Tax=Methylomonas koyamae TaxID=702114 RepID=UPI00112CE022|nr:hypothetical protein [Methylomonas koyamae]